MSRIGRRADSFDFERSGHAETTQGFRSGRDPRPNDIFIAVMGVTGAGKSSFIKLASGNANVRIGHTLESCTSKVEVHVWDVTADRSIFLIDTPGFDDTNRSDTQVLRDIASWMGSSYQNRILLHGIIYLHRISDARMQGSAKKNLLMFKKLCGQDALKRVILVTTMWDRVVAAEGEKREQELVDTPEFWGYMIENGSKCRRHLNQAETARNIVKSLAKHSSTVRTNLQKELIDEHRSLDKTSAGKELESEIRKERDIWAKKLKETEREMREAIRERDREAEKALQEERDRYTSMIKDAEKKTGSLRYSMENLLKERDERVAALEKRLLKQEAWKEQEMRALEESARRLTLEKAQLEAKMAEEARQRQQDAQAHKPAATTPSGVQATAASTSVSTTQYPAYSVSLHSTYFFTISPKSIYDNMTFPARVDGSRYVEHVSAGVEANSIPWIARYSAGGHRTWQTSHDFMRAYPRLDAQLTAYDLQKLEYCVLGPRLQYYARWLDGRVEYWTTFSTLISECSKGGNCVFALAFGYGDSYCLSFGPAGNARPQGYKFNLYGHYPGLNQFLEENLTKNISIQAIALNPTSMTDYIIVYHVDGDDRFWARWFITDKALLEYVTDWWNNTVKG